MNGDSTSDVSFHLSPEQARTFIEFVTNDDDFRASLTDDPGAVLAEFGIEVPPSLLPEQVSLPSKHELEALHSLFDWVLRFRADPNEMMVHHTFFFCIFAIAKMQSSE
jgi:putative modified peptide